MEKSYINTELKTLGIELSDNQQKKLEMLIQSKKMNVGMVKKLLLPKFPEYLLDISLDVMGDIELNL